MTLRDACLTYTLPSLQEARKAHREAVFFWLEEQGGEPP